MSEIETETPVETTDTAPADAPSATDAAPAADAPPPVESYWRDDWRERLAGTNEKELKQLRRYASPEGIWRKARELESRLSSGEFKRSRPDTTDEAAIAAWRKEVGVPDTPGDYADALPEDFEIDDGDAAGLAQMFGQMHEMGVPVDQAAGIVQRYYSMVREAEAAQSVQDKQFRTQAEVALRAEWGHADFRPTLNAIGQMVREHGGDELVNTLMVARGSDGRLIGDNPRVLQFLGSLAREVYPDGFTPLTPQGGFGGGGGLSIDQEIAQLETEMRDTHGREPGGYWNSPQKQERLRQLYNTQERMEKRRR